MLNDKTISKYSKEFIDQINTRKFFNLTKNINFLFLCGANQFNNDISERRKAIKIFVEKYFTDWHIVIAEKVFNAMVNIKGINSLDIEHYITEFSDFVLIILESESAFTELGAFSHNTLRKKVLIVNNSDYIDSLSFINTGPIKAIINSSSINNLMYYCMRETSKSKLDGIGEIFPALSTNLKTVNNKSKVSFRDLYSSNTISKVSLFFIHDLIYIYYGITRSELVNILISIFGNNDFKNISLYLAILEGVQLIRCKSIQNERYYFSNSQSTIYSLSPSIKLLSSVRLFSFKSGRV
jgi:hypothetical protein